jgi:hypothetical protein
MRVFFWWQPNKTRKLLLHFPDQLSNILKIIYERCPERTGISKKGPPFILGHFYEWLPKHDAACG